MPFCYAPWTNIDISPQGEIAPCCKFEYKYYDDEQLNIITSDLQSFKQSRLLEEIKQDFSNNQWPKGCERCKVEEETGVGSKRTLDYDRWKEHYDNYDLDSGNFITASIAFGNTCNLKCITCRPYSSSKWYSEYKLIYGKEVKPNHFYKKDFVADLVQACPELVHLDIPGGEPMISGVVEQKQLLDYYIETDQAKNISIHYTTNNTIFPDKEWWERWQHFKEIDMQLSIDGIGKRNEYIRFPSEWTTTEEIVDLFLEKEKQMPNLRLSLSHTISAYSALYLDEFFSWCSNKGLPRPWVGRVFRPEHMRYSVFPQDIRNTIAQHLRKSKFDDVHIWADDIEKSDDSEYYQEFLAKTRAHDNFRKNNFAHSFPELAEILASYNKHL